MLKGHFTGKLYPFGLDTLNLKNFDVLERGLRLGLNLIDTSTQFTATETAVGKLLKKMTAENSLKRSDVCISSKVGIHFGNDNSKYLTRIKENLYYSIHPKYLESQLTQSLSRFGAETLDMFLLNTPERLLQSPSCTTSRLSEQISIALEHLYIERARGRIRNFGIASTTAHLKNYMHLDGFDNVKVLQFPLNVFEKDALDENLIDKWTKQGILCVTQRPRVAITKNGVIKLVQADLEKTEQEINENSTTQFDILSEMELDSALG